MAASPLPAAALTGLCRSQGGKSVQLSYLQLVLETLPSHSFKSFQLSSFFYYAISLLSDITHINLLKTFLKTLTDRNT